jgi:hypothetical protein
VPSSDSRCGLYEVGRESGELVSEEKRLRRLKLKMECCDRLWNGEVGSSDEVVADEARLDSVAYPESKERFEERFKVAG